jgi:hypothetical protein
MSRPALLEGNPAHQPRNSDLTIGVPHVGPSDRERGWRGLGCPLGTHGRRHHLRSGSDEPDGANGTRAKALYFTSGETGPAVILVHGSLPGSSGRARWRCIAPFLSSRTMARTHRQSHPALIATESKSGLFGTRVILAIYGPSCSTQNLRCWRATGWQPSHGSRCSYRRASYREPLAWPSRLGQCPVR